MVDMLRDHWDRVFTIISGVVPVGAWFGFHRQTHLTISSRLKSLEQHEDACRTAVDTKLDLISAQLNRVLGYIEGRDGREL